MRHDPQPEWIYNEQPLANARQQLTEYFAGERKDFDLPARADVDATRRKVIRSTDRHTTRSTRHPNHPLRLTLFFLLHYQSTPE